VRILNKYGPILYLMAKIKKNKEKHNKEKLKEKPKEKIIDYGDSLDIRDSLITGIQNKEKDNITGIYSNNVGVKKVVYSGLPSLDRILSFVEDTKIYGLPFKIIEVYGKQSSGKTTLAKYLCCSFIKKGGLAFFVDFEHKFAPQWFKTIAYAAGITDEDINKYFRYVDPKSFENFCIWLIKTMKKVIDMKSKVTDLTFKLEKEKIKPDNYDELKTKYQQALNMPCIIVIDSIASMYTESELKDEEEDQAHVAELARGFSNKLKLIRRYLGEANTLIVFTNQERSKIAMGGQKVRPGMMVEPGGNAVKHYEDARLEISFVEALKRTRGSVERIYGSIHKVRVTKNQLGVPPFQFTELRLLNDRGFFSFYSVLEACVEAGLIKKTGPRYIIKKDKIEFEESELDEIQNKMPKIEGLLHNLYQQNMEKISYGKKI